MNMQVEVLKSKIHRVTITQANLSYVGSITVDEDLLDAAHLIAGEKVQIVNVNNGERLETYIIKGERGSGAVCLNGPAARKCVVGDVVIIISYARMDFEEAKSFTPWVVFPDTDTNRRVCKGRKRGNRLYLDLFQFSRIGNGLGSGRERLEVDHSSAGYDGYDRRQSLVHDQEEYGSCRPYGYDYHLRCRRQRFQCGRDGDPGGRSGYGLDNL